MFCLFERLLGISKGALALVAIGVHVSVERMSAGLVADSRREAVKVADVVRAMIDEEPPTFLRQRFPPSCALGGSPVGLREVGDADDFVVGPIAVRVGVGVDGAQGAGELAVDALSILENCVYLVFQCLLVMKCSAN